MIVVWLFLMSPQLCPQFVDVFPDHTHLHSVTDRIMWFLHMVTWVDLHCVSKVFPDHSHLHVLYEHSIEKLISINHKQIQNISFNIFKSKKDGKDQESIQSKYDA